MKKELLFYVLIAIGSLLRLIWPTDMEWKTDEKLVYAEAHQVVRTGVFPEVGIKSGGGIVNPGMSIGMFAAIAAFTDDPIAMVRVVQWVNVLSLLGFVVLARRKLVGAEREAWVAGLALAAVSPLAVLFSRKIWAQDLLPAFVFVIVTAHMHREKGWAAFIWGLAGALMGQVHMSGFFYAFGLFLLTVVHDRANGIRFQWIAWLLGSALGALTMLPWVAFLATNPQTTTSNFWNLFQLNLYFYWLIDALGLDLYYSLRDDFWTFIRYPIVGGTPTYLVALLHILLVGFALFVLKALFDRIRGLVQRLRQGIDRSKLLRNLSVTRFYLLAILLALGVFLPLSGATIYQHYLICAFPFPFIFLAKLLQPRSRMLMGLAITQLALTVSFMLYIHFVGATVESDYGVTYGAQQIAKP